MIVIGVILLVIGIVGAWGGPVDSEYAEDWGVFGFGVLLAFAGLALIAGGVGG